MAKYGITDAQGLNDLPQAIQDWLEQCRTSGLTATREMKFEAANKASLREVVEKKFETKQKAKEKKQPKVMAEKQTKDISERLDSGKLSIEALEALLRQRKLQQ